MSCYTLSQITDNIVKTRTREANARDVRTLPAFFAREFVHVVEPRKFNVTEEKFNLIFKSYLHFIKHLSLHCFHNRPFRGKIRHFESGANSRKARWVLPYVSF